eukprot:XP_001699111.1 predicted protein [Chlamydomonas reinhardtii]
MLNETKVWGDKGITEDVVDSLHNQCPPTEVRTHACVKSQRFLIKNGTVYVTNLMPKNGFGAIELIGFLVELYEASQVYQLPDVEFSYWHDVFCAWYYRGAQRLEDGTAAPCPRDYYNDLYYNHSDKIMTLGLLRNYTNGTVALPLSLHEQHKYKYLVSTDGWAISSKFDKYLLLGSLLFKAEGQTYGWYYPAIKPFEHYVPIMKKHKDDLLDMLEWAKSHDMEAQRIAQNAQGFAMRNLNRPMRLCYIARLIQEIAKNMKYKPDCSKRPVCVPLVEEIKFLGKYEETRHRCRYQEVLTQYAHDDPDALPGDSGFEELKKKHEAMPLHIMFGGRR